MATEDVTTLSLWLIPEPRARARLRDVILRASRRLQTPRFEPHLTLLGGIAVDREAGAERTRRLAARLTPLSIELIGAAHGGEYFRCVVLEAARSEGLLSAHRAARRAFSVSRKERFSPHMSIVYGRVRAERRDRIARGLLRHVPMVFRATELALVATEGPPRDWRTVESVSLNADSLAGRTSRPGMRHRARDETRQPRRF